MSNFLYLLRGFLLSAALHIMVIALYFYSKDKPQNIVQSVQSTQLTLAMFQAPAAPVVVNQPKEVAQISHQKLQKAIEKKILSPLVVTDILEPVKQKQEDQLEPDLQVEVLEPESVIANVQKEATVSASQANEPVLNTEPVYLSQAAPNYPRKALSRGQQGTVLLMLLVGRDGQVMEVSVIKSSGVGSLDRAAIKAVKRWRLQPSENAGVTVVSRVKVPVKFDLRSG